MDINQLQKILDDLKITADWVGLRYFSDLSEHIDVRDEKPELNYNSHSQGIMVEALVDGCFSYFGTNNLSKDSIQKALDEAQAKAKILSKNKIFNFSEEQRPKAVGEYYSPQVQKWDTLTQAELSHRFMSVSESMKVSDKVISRHVSGNHTQFYTLFVSTNGSEVVQKLFYIGTHIAATVKSGQDIQFRSDAGFRGNIFQKGFECYEEENLRITSERICKEALELLDAENCPDEIMDLVLSPDQMMLQIHESIGHPLELDRILGDERNYAGSSFVKTSDFGNLQYGSPLLNVSFDPTIQHELASYGFDDCGDKATKEFLIKEGKLVRGLGGLESQARSGLPGVANFRAKSWNRAPIDRMANINVEPGDSSLDDIIKSIEKGILMESNRSWSIDDYRNKFQFGCEYARLIENGELTKVIKNPNYRGISSSFWRSLDMVGNNDTFQTFGSPHCGKGEPNQAIWVGHASPVCKFKNVEVFGG